MNTKLKALILGLAMLSRAMGQELPVYDTAPLPKDIVDKTLEQLNRELFDRQGETK